MVAREGRIVNRLDNKIAGKKPLLACYFPVADPIVPASLLQVYCDAGVDIVELGVPSADPFMDGADVAQAMGRALAAGGIWPAYGLAAKTLRQHEDGPASVCMTYADLDFPGLRAADAWRDIDGLLMVHLGSHPDRAGLEEYARSKDLRLVGFIDAALTPSEVEAARQTSSYIMLQAAPGPTGPRTRLAEDNSAKIAQVKASGIAQPILLGFGISSAEQVREAMAMGADGVVIGSMCVRAALEGEQALANFLNSVRVALDG
jgi:tryptophan synthase alpha chain